MNKKLSILLMSIIASGAHTIKSESIAQKLQKLEQLQQEIFEGFFGWDTDVRFNTQGSKETNTVTITVTGIEFEGEQPDADVEMSEEKNLVEIKIPSKNGILEIAAQSTILSINYNKQIHELSEESPSRYTTHSINNVQARQIIDQHIDSTIIPQFSYDKEKKELSIVLHTIPEKGYQKKNVPISFINE